MIHVYLRHHSAIEHWEGNDRLARTRLPEETTFNVELCANSIVAAIVQSATDRDSRSDTLIVNCTGAHNSRVFEKLKKLNPCFVIPVG